MAVIPSGKIVELAQAANLGIDSAKQALIKAVGDITKLEICGENLLVATYIRAEKTKGGIIKAESTIQEDEFQGNIGLVLVTPYEDLKHQWVLFGYNDGLRFRYNDVPCRIISIDRIRAIIPDPAKVL